MNIGQILEDMGEIHSGVAIGYCDVPPALQWPEHHEQVDGSIPLILIVLPRGLSWLHLDRHTRFADQLL
jgi:hypothetical protein